MEKQTTDLSLSSTDEPFSLPHYAVNFKPMTPEEEAIFEMLLKKGSPDSVNPEQVIPLLIEFIDGVMPILDVFIEEARNIMLYSVGLLNLKLHPDTPEEFKEEFNRIVKGTIYHNMSTYEIGVLAKSLTKKIGDNLKNGLGFQNMSLIILLFFLLGSASAQAIQNASDQDQSYSESKASCYKLDQSKGFTNLTLAAPSDECKQLNQERFKMTFTREFFNIGRTVDTGDPTLDQELQPAQKNYEQQLLAAFENPNLFKELLSQRINGINTELLSLKTATHLFMNQFSKKLGPGMLDCVPTAKSIMHTTGYKAISDKLDDSFESGTALSVEDLGDGQGENIPLCMNTQQESERAYQDVLAEFISLSINVEKCELTNNNQEMTCDGIIQGGMMHYDNMDFLLNNLIEKLIKESGITGLKTALENPTTLIAILAEYGKQQDETWYGTTPRLPNERPLWIVSFIDILGQLKRSNFQVPTLMRKIANNQLSYLIEPYFLQFFVDHYKSALFPELLLACVSENAFLPSITHEVAFSKKSRDEIRKLAYGPTHYESLKEGVSTAATMFGNSSLGIKSGHFIMNASHSLLDLGLESVKQLNRSGVGLVRLGGNTINKGISTGEHVGDVMELTVKTGATVSIPIIAICLFLISCGGLIMTARWWRQKISNQQITNEADTEILKLKEAKRISDARKELGDVKSSELTTTVTSPPPLPQPPNNAPAIYFGQTLYDYLSTQPYNKFVNMYIRNGDGSFSHTETPLKIYRQGTVKSKINKVVKQEGNSTNYPVVPQNESYSVSPGPPPGGGTRKHKKRIGAASKHHKKRRRGTKKPSKKRRATRRKRR